MLEPLALLAILEQAGGGHNKHDVEADDAEERREDVVNEDVGEARDRGRAPAHDGRGGLARARRVRHEGRAAAVEIAAAVEL